MKFLPVVFLIGNFLEMTLYSRMGIRLVNGETEKLKKQEDLGLMYQASYAVSERSVTQRKLGTADIKDG